MKACLIHTVATLPDVFDRLLAEQAPGTEATHVVDESLLADTIAHGMVPATRRRLAAHVAAAEDAGAEAVLVTCSSLGEVAELVRPFAGVPVYRIDTPMAVEAITTGDRIAVLATLESTLGPTRRLLAREAGRLGRDTRITTSLCPGAFDAQRAGDLAEHDNLVATEARRLAATADVLVLAQASMARALPATDPYDIPVLTSPRSGVRQLENALPAG
jgi:aspartate/glutamate racemase